MEGGKEQIQIYTQTAMEIARTGLRILLGWPQHQNLSITPRLKQITLDFLSGSSFSAPNCTQASIWDPHKN